jgi:hypothetical protein
MTTTETTDADVAQALDIQWILEGIPHVSAWCYRAITPDISVDLILQDCSNSCHDYRVNAASLLYDRGVRPPINFAKFQKVIPSQSEATEPPESGENEDDESS